MYFFTSWLHGWLYIPSAVRVYRFGAIAANKIIGVYFHMCMHMYVAIRVHCPLFLSHACTQSSSLLFRVSYQQCSRPLPSPQTLRSPCCFSGHCFVLCHPVCVFSVWNVSHLPLLCLVISPPNNVALFYGSIYILFLGKGACMGL